MTHKHKPVSFKMDMSLSGHDSHNRYLYGYRLTCSCGASKVQQFHSAQAANEAVDDWKNSGIYQE